MVGSPITYSSESRPNKCVQVRASNKHFVVSSPHRPMGDLEVKYLIEHKLLPDTQPYQAIIEGQVGRAYATKYLTGKKWTDTHPTTVVEFTTPVEVCLYAVFVSRQNTLCSLSHFLHAVLPTVITV